MDDEFDDQVDQVGAQVEALGEGVEVVVGVIRVLERLVRIRQHGLDSANHGVGPLELRQASWLALADELQAVDATSVGDGSKASEAAAEHISRRRQVGADTHGDGRSGGTGRTFQLRADGVTPTVERHRCDERDLVLGAATRLATGTLAAEVGVGNLDPAVQAVRGFDLDHGHHGLVVRQPGGQATNADLALPIQCRQPSLGSTEQADRQQRPVQRRLDGRK